MTADASDIDVARIAHAGTTIDPVYLNTPQFVDAQLSARLGRPVLTKIETLNPLRSFKGRGTDFLVSELPAGSTVVCASDGGNFGQGIAAAATRYGLLSDVFAPRTMSSVKLRRIADLGARLHLIDDDPQRAAHVFADGSPDRILAVDGRDAAIAEGAGTIGIELLHAGGFDTVLVPVGDGALIAGIACWIKAHAPSIRVVGVGASAAPAMMVSWRSGQVHRIEPRNAFAAGITIDEPHPAALRRLCAVVDDMVLVDNDQLVAAMHLAAETLGVLLEPSGAAGLAAIASGQIPGTSGVATVLTGGNVDLELFSHLGSPASDDVSSLTGNDAATTVAARSSPPSPPVPA